MFGYLQVGADEHIAMYHADAVQWLSSTEILSLMLDKLYDEKSDARSNAAAVLTAIARTVMPIHSLDPRHYSVPVHLCGVAKLYWICLGID